MAGLGGGPGRFDRRRAGLATGPYQSVGLAAGRHGIAACGPLRRSDRLLRLFSHDGKRPSPPAPIPAGEGSLSDRHADRFPLHAIGYHGLLDGRGPGRPGGEGLDVGGGPVRRTRGRDDRARTVFGSAGDDGRPGPGRWIGGDVRQRARQGAGSLPSGRNDRGHGCDVGHAGGLGTGLACAGLADGGCRVERHCPGVCGLPLASAGLAQRRHCLRGLGLPHRVLPADRRTALARRGSRRPGPADSS